MIALLSLVYGSFYFLFFKKLKWFKESVRNISIFVGIGIVMIGAIVFSWWTFAPTAVDGRVFKYVIPIVPNVAGQVVEVPVEALQPLQEGDVLYRIDPTPYQFEVDRLTASIDQGTAQRRLAEINVERAAELVRRNAGPQAELDRWTAELESAEASIASLQAQLAKAQWQLEKTEVRAPYDGSLVNLQLRPGNFVTTMPVAAAMSFVSDETSEVVASFSQSAIRHINVGDEVEMMFGMKPGEIFTGKVKLIVRASGASQLTPSGNIPIVSPGANASRWAVRVELDDADATAELPQSASATILAVYTQKGKPVHVISKVVMRMNAWTAYLTSP